MPISANRYVDIKSGINNIRTATEKDLIARIFTTNELVPKQEVKEFEGLDEVETYFGENSDEYKIAERYFGFISKYQTTPQKISFARDFETGINAYILGGVTNSGTLTALKAITAGSFDITVYGVTTSISGIDLSSITEIADASTIIETALTSAGLGTTVETGYLDSRFIFATTGAPSNSTISISDTPLTRAMLIDSSSAISCEGSAPTSYSNVFKYSYQLNNNFATFVFLNLTGYDVSILASDIATLGQYVKQTYPSEFMMVVPVTTANASAIHTATAEIDGISLELCGDTEDTGKFNFVIPMAITATTDYNRINGTQNYMYNQFDGAVVMVDDDPNANTYDNLKVNYYGRTQSAGQKLAFYQRGVLQGDYQDQNIFTNEIWLKDALTTTYVNYMLMTPNWYANKAGKAIGQALAMDIISRAKLNGTITTEKELTANDKVFIYNITNDNEAWRQVYQEGYYLVTSITKETINRQTVYKFNYVLVYSKGDSIKKVEGKDILI
jgi:hypothetical protein